MTNYKQVGNLKVAPVLYQFINEEALPGSGLSTENFWSDFEALVTELTPVNKRLLEKRDSCKLELMRGIKKTLTVTLANTNRF